MSHINNTDKGALKKETNATQATKEEIAETKRRCWGLCKKTAIIEDRGGWRWCLKHYWMQRDGYFSKARKIIWSNLFKLSNTK